MPGLAVIFFFLQIAFGYLFSTFLDPEKKLTRAETFFVSVVLGLISSLFLLLSFLLILRSWSVALTSLWIVLILAGIYVLWRSFGGLKFKKLNTISFHFIYSGTFWGLFVLLFLYAAIVAGVFFVDKNGFPQVIFIGWGDSAYHLDMIGRLKTADPFLLDQPILSGERLTYPFLINLLSAVYEKVGFPKLIAWHLPLFLFGASFFFLIFFLGKRIFSSNKFSLALVMLVFFGAGIGFFWFFQDLWVAWQNGGAGQLLSTVVNPPHEYTHLDNRTGGKPSSFEAPLNIVWIVPAISFLSHQRSFVSGVALASLIFLGFIAYRGDKNIWRWGIVWGMIPFSHAHTFIAVSIIISCWFFFDVRNYLAWLKAGILGSIVALPQVVFLMPAGLFGAGNPSFFKPWLGWMTCTHELKWYACDPGVDGVDSNPFWFWTKNFGFVFWIWILAAFFMLKEGRPARFSQAKLFIMPSLVLFLLPNLMLFQPWEFDNNKILFYWWILASIVSILFFQALAERRRIPSFVFIVFVALAVFSGMIDVLTRVAHFNDNHFGYYGPKEVKVAMWIQENTNPNDRFLTGDNPSQFVPMLTGRSLYLGFTGWLWPQGKGELIGIRKTRARYFLRTGDSYMICEDGVKYVLWDRELLKTYPGADRERVSSVTNVAFSQNLGSEKIEILEIQCPKY